MVLTETKRDDYERSPKRGKKALNGDGLRRGRWASVAPPWDHERDGVGGTRREFAVTGQDCIQLIRHVGEEERRRGGGNQSESRVETMKLIYIQESRELAKHACSGSGQLCMCICISGRFHNSCVYTQNSVHPISDILYGQRVSQLKQKIHKSKKVWGKTFSKKPYNQKITKKTYIRSPYKRNWVYFCRAPDRFLLLSRVAFVSLPRSCLINGRSATPRDEREGGRKKNARFCFFVRIGFGLLFCPPLGPPSCISPLKYCFKYW